MSNQPLSPRTLRIRRRGTILGEYPAIQASLLFDTGEFTSADECYDHTNGEWIPLADALGRLKLPVYGRAQPATAKETGNPSRRTGRIRLAWIVAALAAIAGVAAALWGWNQTLAAEILRQRLTAAREAAAADKEEVEAAEEMAPEGTIRGRVILRDPNGRRRLVTGMKVRLYKRKALDQAVDLRHQEFQSLDVPSQNLAAFYLRGLPHPLAMTATGSDGRFEFSVDEPGDYVVQTSSLDTATRIVRLWLVAVDSTDPLNTPLLISESNAAQVFSPMLIYTEGR